MSITRMVLRLCTTKAVRLANTFAEDRVKDSSIVELQTFITENPRPVVLVYTDESTNIPQGKEVWGGKGTEQLILVLAIAGATEINGETIYVFNTTDAATEMSLDLLERQIQAALMNTENPWAEIWRGLVTKVVKWESKRGASSKEGGRFAARQITIDMETVFDPIPGQGPVVGVWSDFLDLLTNGGDTDMAMLAAPLRLVMEGQPLPDWKYAQTAMGLTFAGVTGIGLGPIRLAGGGPPVGPVDIREIIIRGNGLTSSSEDTQ